MGLTPFQMDLRNGMSLEDALKKYNLTLKEALDEMPGSSRRGGSWRKATDNSKNIQHQNGRYIIIKKHNGKTYAFGTYKTLSDAQIVRDYMDNFGWELLDVGLICALLGVERLKKNKDVV